MPLTTITLPPYAQGNGSTGAGDWQAVDPPTYFGSGSLSDGSDSSGATIGAELDTDNNHRGEPVALWFKTPDGFDPTALLLQTRMRNTAQAMAYTADAVRQMVTRLSSADNSVMFDREFVSPGGGNPSPISPILLAGVAAATDFVWWAQSGAALIDLDNPTQDGGWYQLDWSFSNDPGDKAALTGDGLRLDLGLYWDSDAGVHVDWFDLFEVSLLVAGTRSGAAPPCQLYPRNDHQGAGSGAIWPPASSQQAGHPGSYY